MGTHDQQQGSPAPEALLRAAMDAWDHDVDRFAALLHVLIEQPAPALKAAEAMLEIEVAQQWERGWTPADVVHVVTRQLMSQHVEIVREQVLADGRRRRRSGQALHPRWEQQLAALDEHGATPDRSRPDQRLRPIVELLCLVVRFPSVALTMPPPGQAGAGVSSWTAHLDTRMLTRVRALLAKAESTPFEEEAEAFTAKAQELIARHAIDEALLRTVEDVGEPSIRRLLVDDPYADPKAFLVDKVARANRCRAVYSADLGWVTLFGYDHDLDAVELLAASLLTQATGAMVRQGSQRDAWGRSRTRSFRRAFLVGFGQRIGERLRQAYLMAAPVDAADRLLPVLAARQDRLRAAELAAFPKIVQRSTSASNAGGWSAGRAAAELATLDVSPAARRLP